MKTESKTESNAELVAVQHSSDESSWDVWAEEEDIRHDLQFRADWIEADGFARYEVLRQPWYSDDGREWLDDDGEPVSDGMFELGSIELHGGPADGETVG